MRLLLCRRGSGIPLPYGRGSEWSHERKRRLSSTCKFHHQCHERTFKQVIFLVVFVALKGYYGDRVIQFLGKPKGDGTDMANIDRELPSQFRFKPIPVGDWIDMEFVLQEVDQAVRGELLAVQFETMANMHRNFADGAIKMASIIRGGGQQKK